MKKLILALLLPLALFGQATMTSTTTSKAVAVSDTVIYPASTSGMSAASVSQSAALLLIDREAMQVIGPSGSGIAVARGARGTLATSHASGATVWVGSPELFSSSDPAGSCASTAQRVLPAVVISTGRVWDCTAGLWVDRAASSGGGTWGSITGTLSGQTDLQAALDTKAGLGSNTFTGTQTMSATVLGPNTIGAGAGQLPAASASTGQIRVVTDAANGGDCTAGSGTSAALCRSNGSAWVSIGGSGGSITVNGITCTIGGSCTVADSTKVPTTYLDTDSSMAANSDTKVATQKAVKTALLAASLGTAPYSQSFTSQTSVALAHNLNTLNVLVSCYDGSNVAVTPNTLTLTSVNVATITFLSSQTGRCVVNGGVGVQGPAGASSSPAGSDTQFQINSSSAFGAATATWTHPATNANTLSILGGSSQGSYKFITFANSSGTVFSGISSLSANNMAFVNAADSGYSNINTANVVAAGYVQTTRTNGEAISILGAGAYAQFDTGTAYASLPAAGNGAFLYCTDCKNSVDDAVTIGAVCASGGHGALAMKLNTTWRCY